MQRTVFYCVHKEIDNAFSPGDNYSFRESGLQITLRLELRSSLGNTVLLHTLFLQYETQIGQKKTRQCFSIKLQFTCKTSDKYEKKSKNGLKYDIRRLCIQPFNCANRPELQSTVSLEKLVC